MINNYTSIGSTNALNQTSVQPQKSGISDTSELLSTFKELFSTMMLSNTMSTSAQQSGMGVGDLMAPLMLLLIERLVEQQLDTSELSTETGSEKVSTAGFPNEDTAIAQGSKSVPSGMPVSGGRLTQNYHSGHNGLDIGVVVGTPVKTTMDGTVIHAGWNTQGYGNLVIVENGEYRTYYAHLSSIPVSVGDTVAAGSTIGLSGNTGNSTGPHLHYEIRRNKVAIDPTAATLNTSA